MLNYANVARYESQIIINIVSCNNEKTKRRTRR